MALCQAEMSVLYCLLVTLILFLSPSVLYTVLLRGSSMGACEALCDMLACKKGYTNKFDLIYTTVGL